MNEHLNVTLSIICVILIVLAIVIFMKISQGKTIKEFYDNKKLRRKYTVSKNGEKRGIDIFYYRNGKVNKKQIWRHNILDGESKIFYSTGELYIESYFKNNLQNGDYKIFDRSGELLKHDVYEAGYVLKHL